MARRKKLPEQSPQMRRALDFAAVGLAPSAAALVANEMVQVDRESQTSKQRAKREDVFDLLRQSMKNDPGAYDAARRLGRDLTVAAGEHDSGISERVDCDRQRNRMDAMIDASRRVEAAKARVGARDWKLLAELIDPAALTKLRDGTWRGTVVRITGEANAHAQAAAVRSASINLALAYAEIDHKGRYAA